MSHPAHKSGNIPRAGLILHGHFQQLQNFFKRGMWLLKESRQNESGPEAYLHFCDQDLTWSFYSVDSTHAMCTLAGLYK